MVPLRFWLCSLVVMFMLGSARADVGHRPAEATLNDLVARLAPEERTRTRGVYLAFDTSRSDTIADAACDDDGDYVIVLSDAMLDLIDRVSVAVLADDTGAVLVAYETSLGAQPPGAALLPLPAGGYPRAVDVSGHERVRTEILRYVIGAELSHGVSGRLLCPSPTLTRESGDDVWTDNERSAEARAARALYTTANVAAADLRALDWMLAAGSTERGAMALLDAQGALARASSYARSHERSSMRASLLHTSASEWRAQNDSPR